MAVLLIEVMKLISREICYDDDDDDGGGDLISRLPDEILISILCRLSNMEETVRTSVLSSRWRKLWTHTPVLNFDSFHRVYGPKTLCPDNALLVKLCNAYLRWVNRVLELHNSVKTIGQICLVFPFTKQFANDINRLITFAIQNNVPFLELDMAPYKTPRRNYFSFERHPFLSSNPLRLRVVRFCNLDMSDDVLNYILLNSPCLEHLYISGLTSLKKIRITGPSSSNLKFFGMSFCMEVEEVVISQTSLECLKLINKNHIKLVLNNLPQLVDVGLILDVNVSNIPLVLSSCLLQIQKLEAIVTIEELEHGASGELVKWPTFSNLRHLNLTFGIEKGSSICHLVCFLEACPVMQTLQLKYYWTYNSEESVGILPERKTPKVAQKKNTFRFLKVVELNGYVGDTQDAELATFLLENAKSLEKLTVTLGNLEYAGINSKYLERENRLTEESAIQLKFKIPPGAEFQIHPSTDARV